MASSAQIHEDGDLLSDDLGVEWLDEIVGTTGRVGPMNLFRIITKGRDEDDRYVTAAFETLQMNRDLEAIHPRHRDVDESNGEPFAQREPQRFLSRRGGDERS